MATQRRWWAGLFFLAVMAMLALPMSAQTESDNVPTPWLQTIGAIPTMIESPFLVDLMGSAGYDNNVYGNNTDTGSSVFEPGIHLGWQQEAWVEREMLQLDYQGMGLMYPELSGLDQMNHSIGVHAEVRPTYRLSLRVADSGYYQTGLFGLTPPPINLITGPTVEPLPTNPGISVPVSRMLSNQFRFDTSYQLSARASLDAYFTQGEIHFLGGLASNDLFYNTDDRSLGFSYVYRLSKNVWIGPTVSADKASYGTMSHANIVGGLMSASWDPRPEWTFTGFGGVQAVNLYATYQEQFGTLQATLSSHQNDAHPEFGGSVTRQWTRYRASLSGQRTVTDGGGLLATTTSTYEQFDFTRPMGADSWTTWEVGFELGDGLTDSLSPAFPDARLREERAGLIVRHNLGDDLTVRVTDDWTRQRVQNLPGYSNLNRNLFLVGVEWRLIGPAGGR